MHLGQHLALLHRAELSLHDAFAGVADAHVDEAEVHRIALRLAHECRDHARQLAEYMRRYPNDDGGRAPELPAVVFDGPRDGPLGLLRDLHDLYLMAAECDIAWIVVGQAAHGAHDRELLDLVGTCQSESAIQMKWLETQLRASAPQALVVLR